MCLHEFDKEEVGFFWQRNKWQIQKSVIECAKQNMVDIWKGFLQ